MEDSAPRGPLPIIQLGEDVINKIAAAEIIHRPSNAIKELLENSLDAGSTSIKITIKDGGLKLIQIADNGHGINRADLPLLCTRYATSKLREFKDLESIATYGFRGEALASISYCSLVEVVTKTKADNCGWKANYANGVLVPGKAGGAAEPKPAAANDGTIITAEDLFFNMPLRKRAFRSTSDEYNRILDVLTKYAVHNPHCAWVCKKAGSTLPDLSTPAGTTSRANIGLLYTQSLADDLLEVPETQLEPDHLSARCKGWVSNANANWARKGGWLLFINNRLVDSSKIRKAIESMYTAFLPKGAAPWVYLSLHIDPAKVDVNVHPTKSEVHFLNEDEIVEAIVAAVHNALKGANISRSFSVQTILPGASDPTARRPERAASNSNGATQNDGTGTGTSTSTVRKKAAPNYKVRNDLSARTLDAMFAPTAPSQLGAFANDDVSGRDTADGRALKRRRTGGWGGSLDDAVIVDLDGDGEVGEGEYGRVNVAERSTGAALQGWKVEESLCEFTSVQELRTAVKKRRNLDMTEIMAKHAFVGIVDEIQSLGLVQHSTKLYLVNHSSLADEHFYQLGLLQFGTMDRLRLDPPPSLRDLLEVGLQDEPLESNGLRLDDVCTKFYDLLLGKKDMIDEYFSMRFTADEDEVEGEGGGAGAGARIQSIPMLIRGYVPDLDRLPHFLVCLATQVDWTGEKECFEGVLRELAFFYSPRRDSIPTLSPADKAAAGLTSSSGRIRRTKEIARDGNEAGAVAGDNGAIEQNDDADDDGVDASDVADEGVEGPEFSHREEEKRERDHRLWQLEHVLFPSFRKYTLWPAMGKEVVQVANLPDLFRIFERC